MKKTWAEMFPQMRNPTPLFAYEHDELLGVVDVPEETPKRWINAIRQLCRGYEVDIKSIFKTFDGITYDGLVVVGPIKFYSLCEHHMLPFHGQAWVGYLPKGNRVVGLSKLSRLVDAHARRFQVQERMTHDIAADLMKYLKPMGAGVRVEALHTCMAARGAEKEGIMRTQSLLGNFRKPEIRAEFINLCRRAES